MTPAFKLLPDPRQRSRRAVNAQRAGKDFQRTIETSLVLYRKIVTIEPLPAMGACHVGGGKIVTEKICCDYVGTFVGSGVALFADAKSCGQRKVSFDPSMVSEEQERFLSRMGRANAVAGLLVECHERKRYLWLDVSELDGQPMRFARDGKLLRCWTDLGSTAGLVDFRALAAAYKLGGSKLGGGGEMS